PIVFYVPVASFSCLPCRNASLIFSHLKFVVRKSRHFVKPEVNTYAAVSLHAYRSVPSRQKFAAQSANAPTLHSGHPFHADRYSAFCCPDGIQIPEIPQILH